MLVIIIGVLYWLKNPMKIGEFVTINQDSSVKLNITTHPKKKKP